MKKRGRRSNAEKAAMKNKVGKVMHEFKEGDLTTHGKKVTNPKQAIAIALSEAQKMETGGEIESKISKLQKVVDSNLVPDSVKEKAKKEIERLKAEFQDDSSSSIDWKTAKEGDSARVIQTNKMGLIMKAYGRKFHLKFVDGTEKTYDANELEIYDFEEKPDEKLKEKEEETPATKTATPKTPKAASTKMYVKLSSSVNPDRSRGEDGNVSIKPIKVEVSSYKEARDKVLEFIDKHNLGGGNWTGGQIYQGTKQVAHVSYNGRVWEGSDAMSTSKEEIVIEEPNTPEKKEVAPKKAAKKESPAKKSKAKPSNAPRPGQKRDLKKDSQRKALPLGKRISKNGKTYYENRLNEADTDSETKLENGGEIEKTEPKKSTWGLSYLGNW